MKNADNNYKQKQISAKDKLSRIPVKIKTSEINDILRKPAWLKIKLPKASEKGIETVKNIIKKGKLSSVCEEASCPNLSECFDKGTASFMIMGHKCTRRCSFCDVQHGRPDALDPLEPENLSKAIKEMKLKYVVITSVDRDDLRDGGAEHFVKCIEMIRKNTPHVTIEILTPDFRGRMEKALNILSKNTPDCFNHNIETVPQLYKAVRLGADYNHSLLLLKSFKNNHPNILTKSGMMLGLGETDEEVKQVLLDLRKNNVDMLTLGQYLQPSKYHTPVKRYVSPEKFNDFAAYARSIGFSHVASGPMVRSSYHADKQFDQ